MRIFSIFMTVLMLFTGCDYPSEYQSIQPVSSDGTSCGIAVIPEKVSIHENDVLELRVVTLSNDGTRTPVDWSLISYTFDETVLSVSDKGVIRGLSPGNGEIAVSTGSYSKNVPFSISPAPRYGLLVISEVMYSPSENERELEYIEIYNTGETPCPLDGVSVTDGSPSSRPFLLDGYTIGPRTFLVIGRSSGAFKEYYGREPDALPFTFDLSNSGDSVFIKDPAGISIDAVFIRNGGGVSLPPQWGAEVFAQKGKSLSRIDPMIKTGKSSDFHEAAPTPGFAGQ